VNNITVPVAVDGASEEIEVVGDRARAFDGTLRSTRRAAKRKWQVKTAPMATADAQALRSVLLTAAPPLTCTGDLLGGSASCDAEVTGVEYVANGLKSRQAFEFILHEV
jgi:hypothetical protein